MQLLCACHCVWDFIYITHVYHLVFPTASVKYYPKYTEEEVKLKLESFRAGTWAGSCLPKVGVTMLEPFLVSCHFLQARHGDHFLPGRRGFAVVEGQWKGRDRSTGRRTSALRTFTRSPPAPQALLIRFSLTDQIWKVADKRERHTSFVLRLLFFLTQATFPFPIHLTARWTLLKKNGDGRAGILEL